MGHGMSSGGLALDTVTGLGEEVTGQFQPGDGDFSGNALALSCPTWTRGLFRPVLYRIQSFDCVDKNSQKIADLPPSRNSHERLLNSRVFSSRNRDSTVFVSISYHDSSETTYEYFRLLDSESSKTLFTILKPYCTGLRLGHFLLKNQPNEHPKCQEDIFVKAFQ